MTGLSFELTAEQEQLRQMVRDFADRECPKDVARRLEAPKDFPEELARRIAKAGLNGIGVPEEYGGQGGDLIDQTIVCEELSRTLGGLAWLWGITVWSGARASCTTATPPRRSATCPPSRPATCGSPPARIGRRPCSRARGPRSPTCPRCRRRTPVPWSVWGLVPVTTSVRCCRPGLKWWP